MPSEYDFIMDSSQPVKKAGPFSGGAGSKGRMLAILVGVGVLLIILMIVLSSIFGGGPSNKDQLLRVAQQQGELIRVADIGVKDAQGTQAKNLAITTKLSLGSDRTPLLQALAAQKVKGGAVEAGKNPATDEMLETARQNNRFDAAFLEYLQKELAAYQKNLESAYLTSADPALKEALKTQYENASVIIGVEPES